MAHSFHQSVAAKGVDMSRYWCMPLSSVLARQGPLIANPAQAPNGSCCVYWHVVVHGLDFCALPFYPRFFLYFVVCLRTHNSRMDTLYLCPVVQGWRPAELG